MCLTTVQLYADAVLQNGFRTLVVRPRPRLPTTTFISFYHITTQFFSNGIGVTVNANPFHTAATALLFFSSTIFLHATSNFKRGMHISVQFFTCASKSAWQSCITGYSRELFRAFSRARPPHATSTRIKVEAAERWLSATLYLLWEESFCRTSDQDSNKSWCNRTQGREFEVYFAVSCGPYILWRTFKKGRDEFLVISYWYIGLAAERFAGTQNK